MKGEFQKGGRKGKRMPRGVETVPKQFRMLPDIAAALKRAAAAKGEFSSLFLNELLKENWIEVNVIARNVVTRQSRLLRCARNDE